MAGNNGRSNSLLALDRLRALIRDHRDETSYQLPAERELAQSMAVGRRAVRRALEVLEAEGIIWRRQGKGTFIGNGPASSSDSLTDLATRTSPGDMMETRLVLEPGIARLAALRASREDIDALERLSRRAATAVDDDGWELWDSVFHRRIAECAGNYMLAALLDAIQRVRQEPEWRNLRASTRTEERRQRVFREHDEIVAAISSRNGQAAEQAMRRHLRTIDTNLRAQINGDDAAAADEERMEG
ncbi:FadR/GntR family transcriptional regulator [Aliihoeflea sp. PC F10.4]